MDAPQPQRIRIDTDSTHDHITNLPVNVKEEILLKLPIKEAVRTSILSRKWADASVSIPNLVFTESCAKSELIKRVDSVLLVHRGPIKNFELLCHDDCSETIRRWLPVLSRNGIKELRLRCLHRNVFLEIPWCLIGCTKLEQLCLGSCRIKIPTFSQGFKQLRTLTLTNCKLSGISLENMISICPLLEYLALHSVRPGRLCIRATNLTGLDIVDKCFDICLETPKLASACIYFVPVVAGNQEVQLGVERDDTESTIIRVFGRLLNIQALNLQGQFIQYVANGPIPRNFPHIFNHLTLISVDFYAKPNEISATLCMFQNAPNLKTLLVQFITTSDEPNDEATWDSKATQNQLFMNLKVVDIWYRFHDSNFSLKFTKYVLDFARLVLSTAPALDRLKFHALRDAVVVFEMLKCFPKLSKNAEIAF